jgi:hypothetical protein
LGIPLPHKAMKNLAAAGPRHLRVLNKINGLRAFVAGNPSPAELHDLLS